jgi:hypothetical protein
MWDSSKLWVAPIREIAAHGRTMLSAGVALGRLQAGAVWVCPDKVRPTLCEWARPSNRLFQ